MNKTAKRATVIVLICAAAVGSIVGIKFLRDASIKVDVTSVSSLNNGFWGDSFSTTGLVYDTDNQSVRPAPTQIIQEVFVEAGQEVKAGDKLISYDMTSEQLTLQSKQVAVEQAAQAIKNANDELYELQHTAPAPDPLTEPEPEPPATPEPEQPKAVQSSDGVWNILDATSVDGFSCKSGGDTSDEDTGEDDAPGQEKSPGSIDNPRVYKIEKNDYLIYGSFYNELKDLYPDAHLYIRVDAGDTKGRILCVDYFIQQDEKRTWNIAGEINTETGADAGKSGSEPVESPYQLSEPQSQGLTAKELAQRIDEIKKSLPELDLTRRRAELELRMQEDEMDDGIVYAKNDGIVKTVGDPASPPQDGSAFLVVAAGGGTTIQGTVNELMLDQVTPGQTVTCTSWDSGSSYTATVKSIDTYPTGDNAGYYGGNPNVSSYNFYATVEGASDLNSGAYLDLSFDQANDVSDIITIGKAYVRNDAGGYYVMKRGDDDRLVRQNVTTGKIYYGEMVEILDGITADDFIAFPYGDGSKEGVLTRESEEVVW